MKIHFFDKEIFKNEDGKIEFFPENLPTIYGEPTDNQLDDFISNRKSFKIVDLQETGYLAEKIENKIEEYGLTVRNYTSFRSILGLTGIGAIPIAIHNIITWNPDYLVCKERFSGNILVIYRPK